MATTAQARGRYHADRFTQDSSYARRNDESNHSARRRIQIAKRKRRTFRLVLSCAGALVMELSRGRTSGSVQPAQLRHACAARRPCRSRVGSRTPPPDRRPRPQMRRVVPLTQRLSCPSIQTPVRSASRCPWRCEPRGTATLWEKTSMGPQNPSAAILSAVHRRASCSPGGRSPASSSMSAPSLPSMPQ